MVGKNAPRCACTLACAKRCVSPPAEPGALSGLGVSATSGARGILKSGPTAQPVRERAAVVAIMGSAADALSALRRTLHQRLGATEVGLELCCRTCIWLRP